MAGLDTRGLADGFAQGFGLMTQYQRGQAADRRADEQLKIHRDNAAWQRQDGDRRFGLNMDQFNHSVTDSDRRFGLAEKGFSLQERQTEHAMGIADQQLAIQRQSAANQQSYQQGMLGLAQSRHDLDQEAIKRDRDNESLAFALRKGMTLGRDSLSDDEWKLLQRSPHIWSGLNPAVDAAIHRAIDVFDINTPADENDPGSLDHANLIFGELVNVGEGGQKRISGWYPAPDGESVTAELEVMRDDGTTYRAPMTVGRGTEEDAVVMQIPIEKLVNHIQGIRMIRNGIHAGGPEFQRNAAQMYSLLTDRRSDGSLTDVEKARLKSFENEEKAILERHLGDTSQLPPEHPDLARLGVIRSGREAIIGEGGSDDLLAGIFNTLGIDPDVRNGPSAQQAPDVLDPVSSAENRQAERQQRREQSQARQAIDDRLGAIERMLPREAQGLIMPGGANHLAQGLIMPGGEINADQKAALLNELRNLPGDISALQRGKAERLASRLLMLP